MSRDLNDFTPFGYLRNASHRARAWGETSGGNLRTMLDQPGVEWVYPVGRDATSSAGVALETNDCRSRSDFTAIGMTCRVHTCLMIEYAWRLDGVEVASRFFLVDDNALAVRVLATNTAVEPRHVALRIVAQDSGAAPEPHVLVGQSTLDAPLAAGENRRITVVLARGANAEPHGLGALREAETAYARTVAEDDAFLASCPYLAGDWPAHWPEGLHHDFQTTRLLVQPAGGIFSDVWPAWMAAWPRVVFAEGTLDMLRLAYADPDTALRAVASMLRDAPEANVPCVFRDGEYNMVAEDGSRCGTSPAWCLPFLNLYLLYLRTLDRAWLAQIYPLAAAYVEWWLKHRTDADGWLVYKCTWEAGEDGNPRLDPTGSGAADISGRVRPVELQATLAHAAGVLAFFAAELGLDPGHWDTLATEYRRRTEELFDPREERFRDWLIAEDRFLSHGSDGPYWNVDACRYSAQSLTPLLLGLRIPEAEVRRHAAPPWTLWPSWTWSLVESAAAGGLHRDVGQLAFETVDRVYRVTTRRELGSLRRPLPGSTPEFWPEDWRTYSGSDAYGWGATTANLLIRHLFGFKESPDTSGVVFELIPAFPPEMLREGARYAVRQLHYRGLRFDLSYTVRGAQHLHVRLESADQQRDFDVAPGERLVVRL